MPERPAWTDVFRDRTLRAPCEDRAALIDPAFSEVAQVVGQNVQLRSEYQYDFHGRTLGELADRAREELLREARRWTAQYRDIPAGSTDPPRLIFLAGHQPQLFHPGVWLKNFALGALAQRHGAAAVNLVIDSDAVKQTTLQVPGGSRGEPRAKAVPFDAPGAKVPHEERRIADRCVFAAFGRRVAEWMAPLVGDPLIKTYWPMALARSRQTDNLGACLAQSRHQLEGQWGLETLEVPQSWLCETPSFCWFVVHLLAELPRLREVYNQAVREYRRLHRIRSTAHPVPDLAAEGDWIEAPLWVFSAKDPQRRPLFARRRGAEVVLTDRHGWEAAVPLSAQGDAGAAVEQLRELAWRGVKIRSRALLTTLWARLALGDLFLHGIGGAKYDQVTDALVQRFFGLQPPRFMLLSATLYLPINRPRCGEEQLRTIGQQLRELRYHPEQHIRQHDGQPTEGSENPRELIAAKRRWIATPQTPENARTRCRAIRQINEALQQWVEPRRRQFEQQQGQLAEALRIEEVLAWREYGFCLYPAAVLREFLFGLLPKSA